MKVYLTPTLANELRYDEFHEVIRCGFFIGMNVYELMELINDNTKGSASRRADVISDATFLGITDQDKVVVNG